jgi:hypothetical protein
MAAVSHFLVTQAAVDSLPPAGELWGISFSALQATGQHLVWASRALLPSHEDPDY